jgi:hypothetical protein
MYLLFYINFQHPHEELCILSEYGYIACRNFDHAVLNPTLWQTFLIRFYSSITEYNDNDISSLVVHCIPLQYYNFQLNVKTPKNYKHSRSLECQNVAHVTW